MLSATSNFFIEQQNMSHPDSLHNVETIYISLTSLNSSPSWNLLHLIPIDEIQIIKVA